MLQTVRNEVIMPHNVGIWKEGEGSSKLQWAHYDPMAEINFDEKTQFLLIAVRSQINS
jgi:hypothetical protein